jgi:single-strand DNA-binding protein
MVYVEGKLRTRSWEKEGVTRYTTEVIGDNMTMLSTRGSGGSSGEREGYSAPASKGSSENYSMPATEPGGTDDLPF